MTVWKAVSTGKTLRKPWPKLIFTLKVDLCIAYGCGDCIGRQSSVVICIKPIVVQPEV